MGVHDCLQGTRAYKLGLVMGQHMTLSHYIGDTDIIARSRVKQLRVAVLVHLFDASSCLRFTLFRIILLALSGGAKIATRPLKQ